MINEILARILMISALTILATGCVLFEKNNYRSSRSTYIGSPIDELIKDFGPPLSIRKTSDGSEILYYQDRWYVAKGKEIIDGKFYSSTEYTISVNSVFEHESADFSKGRSYEIYSGSANFPNNDLNFKEFARALSSAMTPLGMSRNSDNPDYIILLNLGISDPIVEIETVSTPVFVWVPGSQTYVSGSGPRGSYSATATTSGSVQYAGQHTSQYKRTSFKRFVYVTVYEAKTIKQLEPKMISKVVLDTVGPIDDLRPAAGAMFEILPRYLISSTKGKRKVTVDASAPGPTVFYEH